MRHEDYVEVASTDPKLQDEAGRMAALRRYELLDTPSEPAFDRITNLVKTILDVPICAVSLIDAERQWFKSCVGLSATETARDISFCSHTVQTRGPLNIGDAREDLRFARSPLVTGAPYIRSYLGVPLSTPDGYNLGALCAMDIKPREFEPTQVAVLTSFAALVTDEMELRRIAQIDELTGVATRRGFMLEADRAIAGFLRDRGRAALLVLDIDHFKTVNDTYGHIAGDAALSSVGRLLRSAVGSINIVGRLGGEEFGVLLPGCSLEQARDAAERLRLAIETTLIDHDPPLRITASFGVASLTTAIVSFEQWLSCADQGLYAAKRNGRNRICIS